MKPGKENNKSVKKPAKVVKQRSSVKNIPASRKKKNKISKLFDRVVGLPKK